MTIYIALLRGINVSGHNAIRMPELQDSFSGLGFSDIRTCLQSGNVVFRADKSDEVKLAALIAIWSQDVSEYFFYQMDVPACILF